MEIDEQQLVKILEAFVDVSHAFECELALYQVIVVTLCQQRGLDPANIVEVARANGMQVIQEKYKANYQDLLGKLPRIVELLNSNQDATLAMLRKWRPRGPIN